MSPTETKTGLTAVILAAGEGTRMKSALPKVLHPLCGRPMIDFVVQAALDAGADDAVVVIGHRRDEVAAHLATSFGDRVRTAVQEEQNGTGHAVRCALPAFADGAQVAVLLYGDTPLVRSADLRKLVAARHGGDHELAMLTCRVDDPTGYGRILRGPDGAIAAVREQRDCSDAEQAIDEVNPGMYVAKMSFLEEALAGLQPNNDQGELYLTDIVAAAATRGAVAHHSAPAGTVVGINDRVQLAAAEDEMYQDIADRLRVGGATIRRSARIEVGVTIEPEAVIEHGVVLRGATHISTGARIDVGCVLTDVTVAPAAYVKPYSVGLQSTIGEGAQVGPFSHLRPGSQLDAEVHVGNFVETKQTHLRRGAKANHLAYLGDGDIGERANVGAGTIFCNYDGFQKHQTIIGKDAFIGSDSQTVAPVTVGDGAYVATGTTVTRDVPADGLAIARIRQDNKEGYAPRLKARLKAAAARAKAKQSPSS
ncbi:MAG: bifunctional UDP-N-acetylglucosamine diphosphorylase/glucosamine-1-phosphate N-acetyltransferase GlmU [Deltaproteobacteria bacterium]|nr:bifunctional UDP-N-acetylglucosamine diphosphorylase/glucosamine-1-phosphate N-acetyltransferase GlmU [Deltaproteobacteria bacterium]